MRREEPALRPSAPAGTRPPAISPAPRAGTGRGGRVRPLRPVPVSRPWSPLRSSQAAAEIDDRGLGMIALENTGGAWRRPRCSPSWPAWPRAAAAAPPRRPASASQADSPASSAAASACPAAASSFVPIVEPFDPGHPARVQSAPASCGSQSSTQAIEQCYQTTAENTDAAIDAVQLAAYTSGSPSQRTAILAQDAAWLAARGPVCQAAFNTGGTIDGISVATCLRDESTARLRRGQGHHPARGQAQVHRQHRPEPAGLVHHARKAPASPRSTPRATRPAASSSAGSSSAAPTGSWSTPSSSTTATGRSPIPASSRAGPHLPPGRYRRDVPVRHRLLPPAHDPNPGQGHRRLHVRARRPPGTPS